LLQIAEAIAPAHSKENSAPHPLRSQGVVVAQSNVSAARRRWVSFSSSERPELRPKISTPANKNSYGYQRITCKLNCGILNISLDMLFQI
jgi:hypothetical protein